MATIALGSGANVLGYYMYHGGSNPVGKHSYFNEYTVPRISYDFQAPIREYGQLNASYHRLRALHLFLQDFGELLAPMQISLPSGYEQIMPEETQIVRFAGRSLDKSGFLFVVNYQDHVEMQKHTGVHFKLELPDETLTLPHNPAGLTIHAGISAILPFNLNLPDGLLLKFATAQLLTKLETTDGLVTVFFAPDGVETEFAFAYRTYLALAVDHSRSEINETHEVVTIPSGQQATIEVKGLNGEKQHLLVLTEKQAWTASKVNLWGMERLVLAEGTVLVQNDELQLTWPDQPEQTVAFYPPLTDAQISQLTSTNLQTMSVSQQGGFTSVCFSITEQQVEVEVEQLTGNMLRLTLPKSLPDGVEDALVRLEYLGDTGQAYIGGKLVADHFANGLPWEIGLKRFLTVESEREMLVRLTPLKDKAQAVRFFPTGMAFRPDFSAATGGEISSLTVHPQYQSTISLHNVTEGE
jgi:hypothetical protein